MARLGLTLPFPDRRLSDHSEVLRRCVDLGYSDVFTQETAGLDALTPLAAFAAWAPELRFGSAIASVFSRGPALLAMQAAAVAEAAPAGFVLGIGTSSRTLVEDWNAARFERPWARVRDTLRFLRDAWSGERIDVEYETFRVQGFALERPPPRPPSIHLAALGPRMLELAGHEADGVLLGLLSPSDCKRVGEAFRRAEAEAGGGPARRPKEIGMRIGVVVDDDLTWAREQCRRTIATYLNVEGYAQMHRWLGNASRYGALWQAWRAGDRRGALAAVSDELVDDLFVCGPAARCREGIARFVDAGVTHPVIALTHCRGDRLDAMRALAPERASG